MRRRRSFRRRRARGGRRVRRINFATRGGFRL